MRFSRAASFLRTGSNGSGSLQSGVLARSHGALDVAGEITEALMDLALVAEGLGIPAECGADPGGDVTHDGSQQMGRDSQDVPAFGGAVPKGRSLTIVEGVPAVIALPHPFRIDPMMNGRRRVVHNHPCGLDKPFHQLDLFMTVLLQPARARPRIENSNGIER